MNNKSQQIKCLFGYHDYKIPHETWPNVFICNHCKMYGESNDVSGHTEYKCDKQENIIYSKDADKIETRYEYDKKGNMTHSKNSNGFEEWRRYYKKGNLIYWKDSNGHEGWYDEEGNMI